MHLSVEKPDLLSQSLDRSSNKNYLCVDDAMQIQKVRTGKHYKILGTFFFMHVLYFFHFLQNVLDLWPCAATLTLRIQRWCSLVQILVFPYLNGVRSYVHLLFWNLCILGDFDLFIRQFYIILIFPLIKCYLYHNWWKF